MISFRRALPLPILVLALVLSVSDGFGSWQAAADHLKDDTRDGPVQTKAKHDQHGPSAGHLPGSISNVELVGKLRLTEPSHPGDISDVSALQASNGRWYAYLGDWGAHCQTGGIHIVDITNPTKPRRAGFLNSPGFGYKTEGVQALHIETSAFSGDILVVSNEWCALNPGSPKLFPGGITIYDITRPTGAKVLVQAFGDFDVHGDRANESHSAIAWNAGDRAYVAAIDNEEIEDVDIFDITDPRKPVLISETDLPGVSVNAYGNEKTAHDFDVLQFPDGSWHLMVSDWDAGWIDVDVTDPANPVIVGDFEYAACDQIVSTACPPEGNAHQGEWNSDGTVFVGTDEDFSPFRLPIEVLDGPLAGEIFAGGEFGWTKPVATFPDGEINGPTVFGGYGCDDDAGEIPSPSVLGPLAPGEEAIIVFQRGPVGDPNHPHGACFFSDKVRNGEQAGYNVVIIANHHPGAQAGAQPDAFICGGQGSPVLGTAAGLCVGHRFMHEAFGTAPDYTFPYPSPAPNEPAVGTLGPRIEVQSQFDGWGYARVIDTSNPSNPVEVGQITIPETADPAFAVGFGDLTVHEVEVPRGDPNEGGPMPDDDKLAYFSWYSGGFRVVDISNPASPTEMGHYIDAAGNNFWGVALAKDQNGNRLILASDRDFGLFIFRYTGPIP